MIALSVSSSGVGMLTWSDETMPFVQPLRMTGPPPHGRGGRSASAFAKLGANAGLFLRPTRLDTSGEATSDAVAAREGGPTHFRTRTRYPTR
jgi:hypothetical protein